MQILRGHWEGASEIMSWMLWFNFHQEFHIPDLQYLEPQTRLKKKKTPKKSNVFGALPTAFKPLALLGNNIDNKVSTSGPTGAERWVDLP